MKFRMVALSLALLLAGSTALAHAPVFLPGTAADGIRVHHPVSDPERSWAVYGRLSPSQGAEVIPIDATAGDRLYVQMLVPRRAARSGFRPQAYLIGPGLAGPRPEGLPVAVPEGHGVLAVTAQTRDRALWEGFTQMWLVEYAVANGTFPAAGQYQLVVYDSEGRYGPYCVAIGTREDFGLADVLLFPLVWVRAHIWLWK